MRSHRPAPFWRVLALAAATACGGGGGEEAATPLAVQVVQPRREPMTRSIRLSATVEAYETVPLYAKVAGYVQTIDVDIGDRVREGQVLATLEMPEMVERHVQAESELQERGAVLAKAEAEARLQAAVYARSRGLRAKDAITAQDMDEARARHAAAAAELRLARARRASAVGRRAEVEALMAYGALRAPFAGVVTERFVDRGALVQAATSSAGVSPVVTVARTDTVRVVVEVPEPDVPFLERGDPASFEGPALRGRPFTSTVTRFAGALHPSSRTMRAEVEFANPDGALLPGMFGILTIGLDVHERALTLPAAAVRRVKRAAFVFVAEDGRAVSRPIETGLVAGDRVEVVAGLADGARVILGTPEGLDDGVPIEGAAAPPAGDGEAP